MENEATQTAQLLWSVRHTERQVDLIQQWNVKEHDEVELSERL